MRAYVCVNSYVKKYVPLLISNLVNPSRCTAANMPGTPSALSTLTLFLSHTFSHASLAFHSSFDGFAGLKELSGPATYIEYYGTKAGGGGIKI